MEKLFHSKLLPVYFKYDCVLLGMLIPPLPSVELLPLYETYPPVVVPLEKAKS
jgi:hypothetical protein